MSDNNHSGNWWIWKVFWILLGVTAFEVMLGILKVDGYLPDFLVFDTFLGLAWLTHIFIVLTLIKAGYIVMVFMHLGDEKKSLQWTILVPAFILVPYLLFIILTEAIHANLMLVMQIKVKTITTITIWFLLFELYHQLFIHM